MKARTFAPTFTLVCGPMFSGKSTSLHRYIHRAIRSHKLVDVVLHVVDKRSEGLVKTHNGQTTEGIVDHRVVENSRALYEGIPKGTDLVVIEEAQFFDIDLPLYVSRMLENGISVVAGGLDLTSEGDPFGPMGHLLCLANTVEKITAICPCGAEATRTRHLKPKTEAVKVGGKDDYEAACLACWRSKGKKKK